MSAIAYVEPTQYALAVRQVYAEAETRIIEKVAKRIARGIDSPGWAEAKHAEIKRLNAEISAEIRKLQSVDLEAGLTSAYKTGASRGAAELTRAGIADVSANLQTADKLAVRAIVEEAVAAVSSTHVRILRTARDVYRDVIWEATAQNLTGTVTRREAAQIALNKFADKGVTGFIDAKKRAWDLSSYTEMATRTAAHNAHLEGHTNQITAYGRDLVRVSSHGDCCKLCAPWEGQILSVSGQDSRYPSLAMAKASGLDHPNCVHSWGLYIPGMPVPKTAAYKPEMYQARQRQRVNERHIRTWKKRQAAAITDKERITAKAKIAGWQSIQREHVKSTDGWLRRDYGRESIKRAR